MWDPRISPALKTRYYYTSTGQLSAVAPASAGNYTDPALTPHELDFDAGNRLVTVTRDRPGGGGAAVTRVVYLTPGEDGSLPSGLPDVSDTEVARWAGTRLGRVTAGVAVFGPDHPVSPTPDEDDYPHADVTLVDVYGRQILDGQYGARQWLLNSTAYTADNSVVWSLTGANRARIGLDGPCTAADTVCGASGTTTRADLLASITRYHPDDPAIVADTWGPSIDTVTKDGRAVTARAHSHTGYYFEQDGLSEEDKTDQATGLPWRVPVRTTDSTYLITAADPTALDDAQRTVDPDVTAMSYTASIGGEDGLRFRTANTTTIDPGGLNLATRLSLDDAGRTTIEAPPGHGPDDAAATVTRYYQATGSAGGCDGRPAWVGMLCSTTPGGPISGGVQAPTRTISYDEQLLPEKTTLSANGATTTTTITCDDAGREIAGTVTGGAPGDAPVGVVRTAYNPDNGQVASTWDQATGQVTVTGYDTWARVVSYRDQATADGNGTPQTGTGSATTTRYDAAGRVASTDDEVIRATYTYDRAGDYRGLTTKIRYQRSDTDAHLYTVSAAYDIDGQPDDADAAPGLRLTERSDAAGNTTGRTYTTSDEQRLAAWTSLPDTSGRIRDLRRQPTQDAANGKGVTPRRQTYTYDPADRLSRADDQTSSTVGELTCTVRTYTYRADGARTASTSGVAATMPTTGAAPQCTGSIQPTSGRAHTVDSWGGITATTATGLDAGTGTYTYDPLRRIATLPQVDGPNPATQGAIALGYYADGLPHTTTAAGTTRTWTRDPAGRLAAWTETKSGAEGTGGLNHYDDASGDSPAWTRSADGAINTWLTGPDGTLGASLTFATDKTIAGEGVLLDTPGNTAATHPLAADMDDTTWTPDTLQPTSNIDEYGTTLSAGQPTLTGGSDNTLGWHAQNQRPTNTNGLIQMGVRLYGAKTGQFLSPDPVPGGNSTPYVYPEDPINRTDLDGRCYSNRNFSRYCSPVLRQRKARWTVAYTMCKKLPRSYRKGKASRGEVCGTYGLVDGRMSLQPSWAIGRGRGGAFQFGFSSQPSAKRATKSSVSVWYANGWRGGYVNRNSDGSVGVGWTFGVGYGISGGR